MAAPPPPPATKLFIADLPSHFDESATQQVFGAYGTISACRMMPPRKEGDKAACIIDFTDPAEADWIVTNLNGNMPEGLTEPVSVRYANQGKGKVGKGDGKGWGKAGGKDAGGYAASGAAGDWGAQQHYTPPGAAPGGAAAAPAALPGAEAGGGYGKAGKGKASWEGAAPYDGKGAGKKGGKEGTAKGMVDAAAKGGVLPDSGVRPEEQCVYIRGLPLDTTDLDLYKLFAVFGAIPPRGVKAMKNADGTCTSIGFVDFAEPAAAQAAIAALNGYELADGKSLFLKTKNPAGSGKGKDGKGKDGKGKQLKGDGSKGKGWPAPAPAPAALAAPAVAAATTPGSAPPPPPPPVRPGTPAPAVAA